MKRRCFSSCVHAITVLLLVGGNHNFSPLTIRTSLSVALAKSGQSCSSPLAPVGQSCSARYRRRRPIMMCVYEDAEGLQSEGTNGGAGVMDASAGVNGEVSMIGKSATGLSGMETDSAYMLRALELAARGLGSTRPNPAVGCVIVDKEGVVVGEGFHPKAGEPHAEVWAIRQARERAQGGTAYVTLEPCNHFGRTPPCTNALLESGVNRVVAGMVDPDPRTAGGGLRRLAERGLDVSVGVEGAACQALNAPFAHRIWEKSCYGVLHCSLGVEDSSELEDTRVEIGLTIPPACHSYTEHDAIVVEGRSGVAKLEACLESLPSRAMRVVVITSPDGLEGELGPVSESRLWRHGSVLVVVASEGNQVKSPEPVRACIVSQGVDIVEFPMSPLTQGTGQIIPASVQGTAAATVSRELYRRGMLSAVWDVSPELATKALEGGQIQRILVRKSRSGGIDGVSGVENRDTAEEEIAGVLQAIHRLCRNGIGVEIGDKGGRVQMRRNGVGSEGFTEVVLPVSLVNVTPLV